MLIWWGEKGVLSFIFLIGEVGLGWSGLDGLDEVREGGREVSDVPPMVGGGRS